MNPKILFQAEAYAFCNELSSAGLRDFVQFSILSSLEGVRDADAANARVDMLSFVKILSHTLTDPSFRSLLLEPGDPGHTLKSRTRLAQRMLKSPEYKGLDRFERGDEALDYIASIQDASFRLILLEAFIISVEWGRKRPRPKPTSGKIDLLVHTRMLASSLRDVDLVRHVLSGKPFEPWIAEDDLERLKAAAGDKNPTRRSRGERPAGSPGRTPPYYEGRSTYPGSVSSFAVEVRRRREKLGLTLEELAVRSNLTPNYIGTIEHGKRDPSLSTVLAIARGLRIHPSELFGGIDRLSQPATEAGQLFDVVTPDVQEAVLQLLRSVSRRRRHPSGSSPTDRHTHLLRDAG